MFVISVFYNTQERKKELDVFRISISNDDAILKGVQLLLEKRKHQMLTSVVLSKYVCINGRNGIAKVSICI